MTEEEKTDDEMPKLQNVFELHDMESTTNKHLEKENDKLTMNQELLEYVKQLNNQSKFQKSDKVSCIILPISDEKPLPFFFGGQQLYI